MSRSANGRSATAPSVRGSAKRREGDHVLARTVPSRAPVSTIAYRIRRSARARRVRVTVDAGGWRRGGAPGAGPERAADAAVIELRPWIERRLAEVERLRTAAGAAGRRRTVPRGRSCASCRSRDAHGWRGGAAPRSCSSRRRQAARRAALERWYRRRARVEVAARLDAACAAAGLRYRGLTIRGQKTRWASCSPQGAMSFNWRLLLAPASVLDYVVWHEVCHLEVMDHSPRFWALVAHRCPGYREQVRWLRRHGATLVLQPLPRGRLNAGVTAPG